MPKGPATQQIGQPVSDFSLSALGDSDPQSLKDIVSSKRGAVIVFWSAACAHCVRYDAYFNAFSAQHPSLAFAAIAARQGEDPRQIRAAVEQRGLRFPILLDTSSAVAREWRAQQTPRAYLIAGDRELLYRGAVDNFKLPADPDYTAYLEPAIDDFLSGRPIVRPETASFGCAIETVYYQLPSQL